MLNVRENGPVKNLATNDGDPGAAKNGLRPLTVHFPGGEGYIEKTVTLRW